MPSEHSTRVFTLLQREMQEYKTSLFWTPVVIAGILTAMMLLSVLLSDRITMLGDTLMQVMLQEESVSGMSIRVSIDDDEDRVRPGDGIDDELAEGGAVDDGAQTWRIEEDPGPVNEEEWNFSREWKFTPKPSPDLEREVGERVESLNPALMVLHNLLLMVLVIVSANYLLGSLYNDRKDRSILFWKSMPVSEWEEVLAKLAVALLVAPAIYIGISLLTQVAYILLAMLLAYRMDMQPMELIVDKIEFGSLLVNQVGGWLLTILWVAPAYAWLLLASAAAKRSPFMLAAAPVVGLVFVESLFLGTDMVSAAVMNHIPHYISGESSLGFYFSGPDWTSLNWLSMVLGLLFTGAALWAAVYLRRYRFEI